MNHHAQHLRALVAAFGNAGRGDDAFGPMVIERLRLHQEPGIRAVDFAQRPDLLLDQLDRVEVLVLVDALLADGIEPGEIVECDWEQMQRLPQHRSGTHGLSPITQLQFADRLGMLPPVVHLVGVTISQFDIEQPASPAVAARVGEVVQRIIQFVQDQLVKARAVH